MAKITFPWRNEPPEKEIPLNALNLTESEIEISGMNKKDANKVKDFVVKAVGYINTQTYRREKFERCEYNLAEIRDASEADSYIKIAFSKYSYLIYKAGWRLKSENQAAIDYVMRRFRIMSYATDKPMDILFQEVADDLVRYSNAFLIKSRVDYIPGVQAKGITDSGKPVGGYCRVDPATIKIKRDKYGNVIKYEQGKGETKKQWFKEDVIHIYMDKDANNAYGTPRVIAALDDVKLLRKIEGNVVALIHRFSMPLYQWKIGLPQQGMGATDAEIKRTKREVESSSLDGLIITNEKTEIKSIGAEGSALNAQGYLQYFENRVFSALGVSASQMGRGGAKQDADSMEAQIHDTVKYIQRVISAFIENHMIGEILLEGGFDIFDTNNIVEYIFEEISLETKIKRENHEMLKYQSNVTTYDEARRRMGLKDEPEDEERLYQRMIQDRSTLDQIDRNGEWQEKLAHINAAKAANSNNNNSSTSTSKAKSRNTAGQKQPNKAAENNNRPKNQHGTSSVKIKESVENNLLNPLYKTYYNLPIINEHNSKNYSNILYNEIERLCSNQSLQAMNDAIIDINNTDELKYHTLPYFAPENDILKKQIKQNIDLLINDIQNTTSNNNYDILEALNSHREELDNIINYFIPKFYNYSYIKTGEEEKVNVVYIKDENSNSFEEINPKNITDASLLEGDLDNCIVTFDKRGDK